MHYHPNKDKARLTAQQVISICRVIDYLKQQQWEARWYRHPKRGVTIWIRGWTLADLGHRNRIPFCFRVRKDGVIRATPPMLNATPTHYLKSRRVDVRK